MNNYTKTLLKANVVNGKLVTLYKLHNILSDEGNFYIEFNDGGFCYLSNDYSKAICYYNNYISINSNNEIKSNLSDCNFNDFFDYFKCFQSAKSNSEISIWVSGKDEQLSLVIKWSWINGLNKVCNFTYSETLSKLSTMSKHDIMGEMTRCNYLMESM